MTITITDEIYDNAERLLRLPPEQWQSHLRDMRRLLRGRLIEPEFIPEQRARAQALVVRITATLRDEGEASAAMEPRA